MALENESKPRVLLTVDEIVGLRAGDELMLLDYCPVPEGWAEMMGVDPALEDAYIDYRATVLNVSPGDEPDVLLYLEDIDHEDSVAGDVFREMVEGGSVARASA